MQNITTEISWVIFDLGGIVVSESDGRLNDAMAAYVGIAPDQMSNITGRYRRAMTMGKMSMLEMYWALTRELALPVCPDDVLKHHLTLYRQASTQHDAEIIAIVEMLKKHCSVACLTNIEPEIADICKETGLFRYFHKAFLSIELGMQKPDREIYEKVLGDVGCPPDHIIFVDDRMENVQGARDVGMQGVLFTDAEQLKRALSPVCPSF